MNDYYLNFEKLSNAIRLLSVDVISKAGSGHPGMVLGFADVMTCLAFEHLKFFPEDPRCINRDRLILSAGHGSMLLYCFYFLSGFKNFSLEDLYNFRQLHSKTCGHPEYGSFEAIETSTGPLGQGIANSVGMAIAQKKLNLFCKDIDYKIFCIAGDGCLMEGIAYESCSLAGHLNLDNLIILFDDNKTTIDGSSDISISENKIEIFKSFGFHVDSVDGHNRKEISHAIEIAKTSGRPSFISCKTTIGKFAGSVSGSNKSHGSPLSEKDHEILKQNLGFEIDPDIFLLWRNAWKNSHTKKIDFFIKKDIKKITIENPYIAEATRNSSGKILNQICDDYTILGSADLASSTCVNIGLKNITRNDFSGTFINYGIREHAMAGIMNGIALEGFKPYGSTFLVFSDYMKPSIRLAAIMKLKVTYIFTHDSIGVGEDGPTHQPIEQLAYLRAIPNLVVIRPADIIETKEAYEYDHDGPVAIILSRQVVSNLRQSFWNQNSINKGAYVIYQKNNTFNITIYASGSELAIAAEVALILKDFNIRVVSVPSMSIFFKQDIEYQKSIIDDNSFKVAIEAGVRMPWDRWIQNGMFFGMDTFGASGKSKDLYDFYELTAEKIAAKIIKRLYG